MSNLPDQYLPTPLERQRETMVQQIFTLLPRLNPSLGFEPRRKFGPQKTQIIMIIIIMIIIITKNRGGTLTRAPSGPK